MDVMSHRQVGVQRAVVLDQGFAQVSPVGVVIVVVKKNGLAIVAALHDMLRDIRHINAGKAGHTGGVSVSKNPG